MTKFEQHYPRLHSAIKRYFLAWFTSTLLGYLFARMGWGFNEWTLNGNFPSWTLLWNAALWTLLTTDPFFYFYYKDRPRYWSKLYRKLKARYTTTSQTSVKTHSEFLEHSK